MRGVRGGEHRRELVHAVEERLTNDAELIVMCEEGAKFYAKPAVQRLQRSPQADERERLLARRRLLR
eukprot:2714122-Pyramimonas_sp.AAC.1